MLEILPLLVFTTCAGVAAGAYVISVLVELCLRGSMTNAVKAGAAASDENQGEAAKAIDAGEKAGKAVEDKNGETSVAEKLDANRVWLFPLVGIILLGVGLLGTLTHLGQPLRFMNGMANPASMISQESYWAIAFGILMVVDLLVTKSKGFPVMVVRWLAAVAACGLMFVTGLAYFDCYFVTPWADAITIPLFIIGDLAMGVTLCMLFSKDDGRGILHVVNVAVCVAWFAVACAYGVYVAGLGIQVGAIVAGAIIGVLGSAIASIAYIQGKISERNAAIVAIICSILGVLLVRGAFFAAGVFV